MHDRTTANDCSAGHRALVVAVCQPSLGITGCGSAPSAVCRVCRDPALPTRRPRPWLCGTRIESLDLGAEQPGSAAGQGSIVVKGSSANPVIHSCRETPCRSSPIDRLDRGRPPGWAGACSFGGVVFRSKLSSGQSCLSGQGACLLMGVLGAGIGGSVPFVGVWADRGYLSDLGLLAAEGDFGSA